MVTGTQLLRAWRDPDTDRGRELLKVAEKTVYSMAQNGQLPAFNVGGQWRFKRTDLDQWIEQQKAASRDDGERE